MLQFSILLSIYFIIPSFLLPFHHHFCSCPLFPRFYPPPFPLSSPTPLLRGAYLLFPTPFPLMSSPLLPSTCPFFLRPRNPPLPFFLLHHSFLDPFFFSKLRTRLSYSLTPPSSLPGDLIPSSLPSSLHPSRPSSLPASLHLFFNSSPHSLVSSTLSRHYAAVFLPSKTLIFMRH